MAFFVDLLIYQESDAGNENKEFSVEYLCTSRMLSSRTYMKKLNFLRLEKKEFQILRTSKLIPFFGIFWKQWS